MKKIIRTLLTIAVSCVIVLEIQKMPVSADGISNPISISTDDTWVTGSIDEQDEKDFYVLHIPRAGYLTITFQAHSLYGGYCNVYNEDLTKKYASLKVYGAGNEEKMSDSS